MFVSDKPLFLALLDGFCEGRVADDDGGVGAVCGFGPLRFVRVVRPLVAEKVPDQKHHEA